MLSIICCGLMILGGCVTTPSPSADDTVKSREITEVIRVPVATIQVVNDYLPYGEDPYVDHKLSPSPSAQMEAWLTQKVSATGHAGSLIIRVQEASLRWRKRPGKLRAMKYWPYRAIVRLHLERTDRSGVKISEEVIQATRVQEIHEGYFRTPSHEDWWRMFAQIQKDIGFELKRRLSKPVKMTQPTKPRPAAPIVQHPSRDPSRVKKKPRVKPHARSRRAPTRVSPRTSPPRPLKKPSKRPRKRQR